jgi:hypothetical protein
MSRACDQIVGVDTMTTPMSSTEPRAMTSIRV